MNSQPIRPTPQEQIVSLVPALRAFARQFVHNGSDIDDLVQEAVAKALAHVDRFEPRGPDAMKSWLFTIMRNTFLTQCKSRKRSPIGSVDDLASLDVPVNSNQEMALFANDVRAALKNLPVKHRKALIYVAWGLSYEETAGLCGCEIGTIKSRVNRARGHLAARLNGANVSPDTRGSPIRKS
ncbi:sigma-70 family RNA polymerase sigma factor (plasmid) [Rhizobium sullae]|uniref:Sigma-70 family RNA polymerase sigma factor n=1 Tax=Rhizobium sullae TaxID=50338 RepID=A0ABY5XUH2_RHISU|nr:sigma-70 family RNA polymerase sigma factor [Rhizobium sullae]UWU18273.1 sigma-70 family RNA polymerase sigma factor [Rhizobium sullae]